MRCKRLAGLSALAAFAVAPAAAAQVTLEREERLALDGAGHVRLEHLAGPVRVEAHDGDDVVVRLVIHAGGEDALQAQERAEAVEVQYGRENDALWIRAMPPLKDFRTLFYEPAGRKSGFNRQARFAGHRVTIQGANRWDPGLAMHMELTLLLPRGTGLDLEQHAGAVEIESLSSPVRVILHGDRVRIDGTDGALEIDNSDGPVTIRGHRGPARVTSGSAPMEILEARGGPFTLRTGSGGITIRDLEGALSAETGSGGLRATGFTAGERVSVAGGSGDVTLEGDLSAAREIEVETTRGDILLRTARAPDARIEAENVRGGITVDLPGLSRVRDQRNRFSAVSGEGAGQVNLRARTAAIRLLLTGDASEEGLFGNR